jgi:hypothetical protein
MKLFKNKRNENKVYSTSLNKSKNLIPTIAVGAITALVIAWVAITGRKAEETVSVVMVKSPMYKNEVMTEDNMMEYKMIRAEFEKYSIKRDDGTVYQRLLLWKDREKAINTFAAYPIQKETLLETRSLIISRVDNTDSVLYSFPAKEIVELSVGGSELNSFKTFLQPGDRVNVDAIFTERITKQKDDGFGGTTTEDVEVSKTEPVFTGIMIADIINGQGQSVLDIYQKYNSATVQEQVALDSSDEFREKTEPKTLLIALTPDEKDRYYQYLSKNGSTFRISLPQRVE